jgi:glutamate dehydrogenase/leucine dehydrogenase
VSDGHPAGCQNPGVQIDKLSNTGAFVVVDLDGSPQSAGIVRVAPKVLHGSATALARTATYTFAIRELQVGGASAGISADPENRAEAIATFVADVAPRVASGALVLDAAPGVDAEPFAELAIADQRNPVHTADVGGVTLDEYLGAVGPVVAAEAALGGLDGRTVAVELGPVSSGMIRELVARGARVVAVGGSSGVAHDAGGLDADTLIAGGLEALDQFGELQPAGALVGVEASVLFCGSRQGMVDGPVAESAGAALVVPTGCQPVSAKGLAVLRRRGVVVLPDFVTTAAPTYAGWPAGDAEVEAVTAEATTGIAEAVRGALDHEEGPLLGACYRAEAFLSTWQETLPFGRPIA